MPCELLLSTTGPGLHLPEHLRLPRSIPALHACRIPLFPEYGGRSRGGGSGRRPRAGRRPRGEAAAVAGRVRGIGVGGGCGGRQRASGARRPAAGLGYAGRRGVGGEAGGCRGWDAITRAGPPVVVVSVEAALLRLLKLLARRTPHAAKPPAAAKDWSVSARLENRRRRERGSGAERWLLYSSSRGRRERRAEADPSKGGEPKAQNLRMQR